MKKRKIMLIDDHPIVLQGLTEIINHQPDLIVCGTAAHANESLETIAKLAPDLITLDISLREINGLDLLKAIKLRFPKIPVLMLSMHDEFLYAGRSLRAGAAGYIMKMEPTDRLLAAVRRVLQGDVVVSDRVEKKMLQQCVGLKRGSGFTVENLSDRELEIFTYVGQGLGTRDIATKLHLSVKTIESHREHIKQKLRLRNGSELVQFAIQWRQSAGGPF